MRMRRKIGHGMGIIIWRQKPIPLSSQMHRCRHAKQRCAWNTCDNHRVRLRRCSRPGVVRNSKWPDIELERHSVIAEVVIGAACGNAEILQNGAISNKVPLQWARSK
jgi:hypothetical protein